MNDNIIEVRGEIVMMKLNRGQPKTFILQINTDDEITPINAPAIVSPNQ